ncbi:MAG: LacI family DNA-binding transcriptional regulator [Eubacteriales bacterium]|nr:LacI family DNA-binding transcriptional regulator [Eubacteriales bacterium]
MTIKDIAQRCGTTANTVSRVLRGDTGISEATSRRVREAAEEMGYVRNGLASAMRSGKSRVISVIVDDLLNPHYATLINRIDLLLKREGYDTMTLCTQGELEKGMDMAQLSLSGMADGIFYFPDACGPRLAGLIRQRRVPLVLLDRGIAGVSADVVRLDDRRGGELAAQRLLEAGHERFVYLSGPQDNGAEPLRRGGFLDRLQKSGVPGERIRIADSDRVQQAMRENRFLPLLGTDRESGIFAFNDQIAYYAVNALRQSGCPVPGQASVVGCDYIRSLLPYLQPLSSVAGTSGEEMAQRAVKLLLRRISEPDAEVREEILPVILQEPDSTAGRK